MARFAGILKLRDRSRGLLGGTLAQNAVPLYGVYLANYLIPLATVPYLARVLGPQHLGVLAMAQALGGYAMLAVEYGFSLSATREVARLRGDRNGLARLLAGVTGAQVLIAATLIPVLWLALSSIPTLRREPVLVWVAFAWGVAQGANLTWFFQGMERMRLVAALDVGAKVLVAAGIFAVVRGPSDAAAVLVLQALASTAMLILGWLLATREVPWNGGPTPADIRCALRLGWSLFVFRGGVSLYTVGNVFILGLLAPPHVVGYYAGGEKIARALQGLLGPASQTLYPRLSYLVHRSREQATRLIRTGLGFMCALGLAVSAVAFFGAPFWVHLVLGSAFGPAIPVLRVLALVIPLVALSNVFGIQWMLPLGLDCSFNRIIIGAGFLNIALATALAPRFGALGMALAVLGTEACVTGAMYGYLRRHGLYPSLAPARDGG